MIGNKWLTLITVAVNGLLIILDVSIVNISFPTLTKTFKTEPSIVLWVAVIYSLMTVGFMPILGRIGDLYGRKRIFTLGFTLFTLGLILCSLSQTILQLLLSRVVQGLGGAMNMALSFAIVTDAFPDQERGKALGIMGAVFAIGPLLGFTLGGFILDTIGWRAIFYTRIPICIICIIIDLKLLKGEKPLNSGTALDIWGAGTLFASLACFLIFINTGGRSGFSSPSLQGLAGVATILFILFIMQEKRTAQPVVNLDLFKNTIFAKGCISIAIFGLVVSMQLFLFPYYLIDGINYSASASGLILAIPPILIAVIAPISGWLSDKFGSRLLCTLGMTLLCLGLFLLSRLNAEASGVEIISRVVIFGVGVSLFIPPNNSLLMGVAPKESLGTVGALINTIRQIGLSSGIAIAGTIFTIRRSVHTAQFTSNNVDHAILDQLSLIGAYRDAILMAAIVCCIGIFTSLSCKTTKKAGNEIR
ncbi:MFS transporter [Thermodesulfobacteriota bacterium]